MLQEQNAASHIRCKKDPTKQLAVNNAGSGEQTLSHQIPVVFQMSCWVQEVQSCEAHHMYTHILFCFICNADTPFLHLQRLGFVSMVLTGPLLVPSFLSLWSWFSSSPQVSCILQGGFSPFLYWAKTSKWPLIFFFFLLPPFFFPLWLFFLFCFVLFLTHHMRDNCAHRNSFQST